MAGRRKAVRRRKAGPRKSRVAKRIRDRAGELEARLSKLRSRFRRKIKRLSATVASLRAELNRARARIRELEEAGKAEALRG